MTWKVWLMAVLTVLLAVAYGFMNRADFITLNPQGGAVDLAQSIDGEWDSVCILAPYTTNPMAGEVLGTPLNVELRSRAYSSDSFALLVTLADGDVDGLYEVSRGGAAGDPPAPVG